MSMVAMKPIEVTECKKVTKFVPADEEHIPSITEEELAKLDGSLYAEEAEAIWQGKPRNWHPPYGMPGIQVPPAVIVDDVPNEVPIPASILMMLVGVAVLFWAMRYKS